MWKNKAKYFVFLTASCILFAACTSAEQDFTYDAHGKKDPFVPPVLDKDADVSTDILSNIHLEGIMWDEQKPMAIINDKVVSAGDSLDGVKIKEIKENEVVLEAKGNSVSIKLITNDGGMSPEEEKA